ncbi:hypothetical protein BH20ACI4_BH20ACI4_32380 [soil metagenome]
MKQKQSGFVENEKQNTSLPERRKSVRLSDGLFYFEDFLKVENILEADVITATGWLLEILEIKAGEVFFQSGEKEIYPKGKNIGIFYAPFTFTRPRFKNIKAHLKGIAGQNVLPEQFSKKSFAFEIDKIVSPENLIQIVEILESGKNAQFIEACPDVSLISLKTKRLIDENYQIFPSIARIAAHLKVSHSHLTRQFKKDYGIAPNAYLHKIRIADASLRLTQGEKIIEVSGDVGYNDLSRFYKQFRKSTTKSPGFCQTAKK